MTGRVWRITSNNTYSCELHNVGHLLHTLPTTCLLRDSNLSTRGHIRREYRLPNLWQRRASFIEVNICIYRCTKHTFSSNTLSKTFSLASNTFHYRHFGQRNVLSLWHPASWLGSRWHCFCRTCKIVTLLRVHHIRKGQNFHWWKPANGPPKWHWGHSHCSIKWMNKFVIHIEKFLLH